MSDLSDQPDQLIPPLLASWLIGLLFLIAFSILACLLWEFNRRVIQPWRERRRK